MVNKYYQPGAERAGKVGDLFAAIAPRYDLMNDVQSFGLHRAWKRRLVCLAAPKPGERALDICCGTGDICFALAKRGPSVVGLDFSEPMLAVARAKFKVQNERAASRTSDAVNPQSSANPQFIHGDAEQIPFPDNSFDIVTIGYGLRNLASWERGLEEMLRIARPGGRLLVLDFGKPQNALWREIYFAYLRWFIPVFGRIFCHDAQAYAYILESLKDYPAQHGVQLKMAEMGCETPRVVNLLGGVMSINSGTKRRA
jgi:demethylmenaquinone methyltransferase/2-methoxy-6-polyprenyl-1,4-benzoquinol methylase